MIHTKGIEFKKRTIYKYVGSVKRNPLGTVKHPRASNNGKLLPLLSQKIKEKKLLLEPVRPLALGGWGFPIEAGIFKRGK